MTQNIDFSGSDQIQTPQYPNVYPPFQEKKRPKIYLQTWYNFFKFRHAKPEDSNELFQKLLEDLKELAEYKNSQSRDRPIFLNGDENHSNQNKESLKNSSKEIDISSSNPEKEEPPQDSDIHQLIEECSIEICEEQRQSMEDTMLDRTILSTKEPEYSSSMGYEHLSITPETESDEVTESNAKNLLSILSECEVTLEDKRECDMFVCEDSSASDDCDDHSDIFSDSKIDDDISVYDDDFEDIEYVEASLFDPEIFSVEEENVVQNDVEEEEVDLEDISQIQDVVLREKLLSINRLVSNIESLNDNSTPDHVLNSFESDNSLSDNFSPEFETFCDYTEETRSGNTTHADNSLPEYDSFCFEIEPDQERLINISNDLSNDPLLEEADLFFAFDNSIPPGIENFADDSE
nr:hypothetical protein [Tanacetum cinerariifolium]